MRSTRSWPSAARRRDFARIRRTLDHAEGEEVLNWTRTSGERPIEFRLVVTW